MSRIIYFTFALLFAAISSSHASEVGEPIEDVGQIIKLSDDLNLQIVVKDKKVVAHFYDADSKVVESPADSVLMVVDHPGHKNDKIRILLKPSKKDASLTSNRLIYPPYEFRTRLIIRFTNGDPKQFPDLLYNFGRNVE